jgi:hypothetical protein
MCERISQQAGGDEKARLATSMVNGIHGTIVGALKRGGLLTSHDAARPCGSVSTSSCWWAPGPPFPSISLSLYRCLSLSFWLLAFGIWYRTWMAAV